MRNLNLQKREKFHSCIREKFLEDYMKKIRYQVLKNQSHSLLEPLIEATEHQISEQQLESLVNLANSTDENNAIIHIGNLVIDKLIQPGHLNQKFQLRPKDSQYWPWLIRIIFSFRLYKTKLLEYILTKLLGVISVFTLTQSLQIVKNLLNQQPETVLNLLFHNYKGVLLKLKQHCLHANRYISDISYEILEMIIQVGDQVTLQTLKICSLSDLERVLVIGFSKIDPSQKKFPLIICRIINNILSSKVALSQEILKACINVSFKQNNTEKVKVQLSFLWLSFVQNCTPMMLLNMFEKKLFGVFELFLTTEYKKSQNLQAIKENISQSLDIILEKACSFEQKIRIFINTSICMLNHRYKSHSIGIQTEQTAFSRTKYISKDIPNEKETDTQKTIYQKQQLMDLE